MKKFCLFVVLFFPVAFAGAGIKVTGTWRFRAVPVRRGVVEIRANGGVILRLRGQGAIRDARRLVRLLNDALRFGVRPDDLKIVRLRGGYALSLRRTHLLTVTPLLGWQNRSSPEALAQLWGRRIQAALSRPWVGVPVKRVIVAVGEKVQVPVLGRGQGQLKAESVPEGLVRIVVKGRCVTLWGKRTGKGFLLVFWGKAGVCVPLQVMVRAAQWVSRPIAWVQGRQISGSLLRVAVENAILRSLQIRPKTRLTLSPLRDIFRRWRPGSEVPYRVRVTGEGLLPLDEKISVPLYDFPEKVGVPRHLILSNEPETFRHPQIFCERPFPSGEPLRLLLHHRNGSSKKVWLTGAILNGGDRPAWVLLRMGLGVGRDVLQVGQEVAERYLRALSSGAAVRLIVAPKTVYRFLRLPLSPGETGSALIEMRLESGTKVAYRVAAVQSPPIQMETFLGREKTKPLSEIPDPSPYPRTQREIHATHKAGGRWTFISIGAKARGEGKAPPGDYGVLYRITITFLNPTGHPWTAKLLFQPKGGVARGIFIIDGRFVRTPTVRPFADQTLYRFRLSPNERRIITVLTTPCPGSNYPIHLIAMTEQ